MRLTPRKDSRKKFIYFLILFIIVTGIFTISYFLIGPNKDSSPVNEQLNQHRTENENRTDNNITTDEIEKDEESPQITEVKLAAIGDIMFHEMQLISSYDANTDSYNFKPMFEHVKPYLQEADVTIGNFETTLGGPSKPYTGFPRFNSPDEVADAILDAGVDLLTTVNNHSLDTDSDGLKRTVDILQQKGFKTVGTYSKNPDSRVLIHEANGIKFGIIAYTSSTNGLGKHYPQEQLDAMLNMMTKENIERDIDEAKKLDVDFLIAFMHWGNEYETEPNENQIDYAHFMAEKGVDLILGSHPHVIQKSDTIKTDKGTTFVIYSLGNFISNQRKETLGSNFELTEDGVIVQFTIKKNTTTNETSITNVDYVPTWVLRDGDVEPFIYHVLPIEDFLSDDTISDAFKERMERSYKNTMEKMQY